MDFVGSPGSIRPWDQDVRMITFLRFSLRTPKRGASRGQLHQNLPAELSAILLWELSCKAIHRLVDLSPILVTGEFHKKRLPFSAVKCQNLTDSELYLAAHLISRRFGRNLEVLSLRKGTKCIEVRSNYEIWRDHWNKWSKCIRQAEVKIWSVLKLKWCLQSDRIRLRDQWDAARSERQRQNRIALLPFVSLLRRSLKGFVHLVPLDLVWSRRVGIFGLLRNLASSFFDFRFWFAATVLNALCKWSETLEIGGEDGIRNDSRISEGRWAVHATSATSPANCGVCVAFVGASCSLLTLFT